ncbi:MAG: hypothetical protein KDE20_18240, partial [Caldilineaceae bacterium]|nr:hypothetical protein [Caldilineaceae bacterium]
MDHINCRFFGVFQITLDGEAIAGFHSDKARALLAYLALEPDEHQRAELAALLWPDIANNHALTNLRSTLHRLRQTLDAAAPGTAGRLLTVTRQTVRFNLGFAQVDVLRFRALLNDTAVAPEDLGRLEAAVALYRGELLAGFGIADAAPFEEWLLLRREFYHQQAVLALRTLVTAYETAGRYEAGYALASRLFDLDPYLEATVRQKMRLLARMGHADQALDQFEQLRKRLRTELGTDPAPESIALIGQIAAGEFAATATMADAHAEHTHGAIAGERQAMTLGQARELLVDVPDPGAF